MFYDERGDIIEESGDIVTESNRPIPPVIIKDEIEGLNGLQAVELIRRVSNGDIPGNWYIEATNQFRVMESVGSERVKAIYKIPLVDFGSIYSGDIYAISDEDLEDNNYSKDSEGNVINEEGKMVLDHEMTETGNWMSMEVLYENKQLALQGFSSEQSSWHGTTLSRAKMAFPELLN
jgi:hypothetical protein